VIIHKVAAASGTNIGTKTSGLLDII